MQQRRGGVRGLFVAEWTSTNNLWTPAFECHTYPNPTPLQQDHSLALTLRPARKTHVNHTLQSHNALRHTPPVALLWRKWQRRGNPCSASLPVSPIGIVCVWCVWRVLGGVYSVWCVCVCVFVLLDNRVFVFQQWYTSTMNLLGTWLTDRMDLQLHLYQLKILIRVVKVKSQDSFQEEHSPLKTAGNFV